MAGSSKSPEVLESTSTFTGEVAGCVGDEEHVEGSLEVADHAGAFPGKKWSQTTNNWY